MILLPNNEVTKAPEQAAIICWNGVTPDEFRPLDEAELGLSFITWNSQSWKEFNLHVLKIRMILLTYCLPSGNFLTVFFPWISVIWLIFSAWVKFYEDISSVEVWVKYSENNFSERLR